jgi:hypothetical protein
LFVTFTAPSFGAVHTQRHSRRGELLPCRPRDLAKRCAHGRKVGCWKRHGNGERCLGEPICADCLDYQGQVIWNALAPELWRRTTEYVKRALAQLAGISRRGLDRVVRISFCKVAEYQARFVGAYGGLRIGELAGLRRSRIDLDAGVVDVAETVNELKGRLAIGPPKTKASRRKVSLLPGVVEELAEHLRHPGRPTDFVFRARGGQVLRVSNSAATSGGPAVTAANLDGLRIHDLRHTAVALWIAVGASPKEVAQRAGHTSVSFVLDRYGHLFPEADTALRSRLDDLFRAATEHRRNTAARRLERRP